MLFWIFLDSNRIKDYAQFINLIPESKKIGVVLRYKSNKKLYDYAKILLKICRRKRFKFLISSHYNIAKSIGADGIHYPKKIRYARKDKSIITSCSCHDYNDYKRSRQLFADIVFISPIFNTSSDKNKKELGLNKISLLANYIKCQYSVLGGVSNKNIKIMMGRGINSVAGLKFICEIVNYKC